MSTYYVLRKISIKIFIGIAYTQFNKMYVHNLFNVNAIIIIFYKYDLL